MWSKIRCIGQSKEGLIKARRGASKVLDHALEWEEVARLWQQESANRKGQNFVLVRACTVLVRAHN